MHEHLDARTIGALALAVAGFVLMSGRALQSSGAVGLALALGAAVTFVVLVLVNKPLADSYGGVRAAQMQMTGAGILIAPVVAFSVHLPSPAPAWLWLVVLGVIHTGLAIAVYLTALSIIGATTTGVLGYLEPATAVLWAWLVLNESPATVTLVGGAAILVAGLLVVRNKQPALEAIGVSG